MSDTYTEFGRLTYNQQEIAQKGYGMAASGATDDKLIVIFLRKAVLNTAQSRAQGRRVFDNQDFVKIHHPGESLNIVERPVQESDKQRWPRQWAQYSQGRDQIPDGIPLDLLFPDSPAICSNLNAYKIHTIQQLANLSATAITTVGIGAQEWVNKAQAYMKQAEKGVDFHKFNKELADRDQKIQVLERQLREISERLTAASMQPQPRQMQPVVPSGYDVQTALINNTMEPQVILPDAQFSNDFNQPDLSAQTQRRGRPKGSKNRPKEN